MIYLIGSLRNTRAVLLGNRLRGAGVEVFDDWHAAGPEADDKWREYEQRRGRTYKEALRGEAAQHVYEFDLRHLQQCDGAILVLPCGKSGHLELGWMLGKGKPGFILMEGEPERWDVMYLFAIEVCSTEDELMTALKDWGLKL